MVAVLLLLGLEFMCLGLLALVRFRAAGSVLMDVQLQRLLVVLGVALTDRLRPPRLLPGCPASTLIAARPTPAAAVVISLSRQKPAVRPRRYLLLPRTVDAGNALGSAQVV